MLFCGFLLVVCASISFNAPCIALPVAMLLACIYRLSAAESEVGALILVLGCLVHQLFLMA